MAVVTGGGRGIGAAAAHELARQGAVVVVADPGVGVHGEPLGEPSAAETAQRIVRAGGTALASTASVTDREEIRSLFEGVADRFGTLDIAVNTAGILPASGFTLASEDDWRAVLDVHLNGYLNVLEAALPLMARAGYGRVVGCTSGVGLARTSADSPAYGCAKRTVAALTWQLGPLAPQGVAVNALSPIAATRMVEQALAGSGADPRGLDLSAMPRAEAMAPAVAHLAGERFGWCRGHVVFSAGSELTVIAPPRLLEGVRTAGSDVGVALATLVPVILAPAEAHQRSSGGSNPRFDPVFDRPPEVGGQAAARCVVVAEDAELAASCANALAHWGKQALGIGAWRPFDRGADRVPVGFDEVETVLRRAADTAGPVDSVVVLLEPSAPSSQAGAPPWQQAIDSHREVARRVVSHAAWCRAAARLAEDAHRTVRVVLVTTADTPGTRSAAQGAAQLARSANEARGASLQVFSVSLESRHRDDRAPLGELVARLACADDAEGLAGAELVVARCWLGLRAHPAPAGTVSFGGPAIPTWVDDGLHQIIAGLVAGS